MLVPVAIHCVTIAMVSNPAPLRSRTLPATLWPMRKAWILGGLFAAACGGSSKKVGGATQGIGQNESAASTDLQIPKVDESLCDAKGKDVQQFDLNRDEKPDVW